MKQEDLPINSPVWNTAEWIKLLHESCSDHGYLNKKEEQIEEPNVDLVRLQNEAYFNEIEE